MPTGPLGVLGVFGGRPNILLIEPASVLPSPVIAPVIVPPNVVKAASGNNIEPIPSKKPLSSSFLPSNNSFVSLDSS